MSTIISMPCALPPIFQKARSGFITTPSSACLTSLWAADGRGILTALVNFRKRCWSTTSGSTNFGTRASESRLLQRILEQSRKATRLAHAESYKVDSLKTGMAKKQVHERSRQSHSTAPSAWRRSADSCDCIIDAKAGGNLTSGGMTANFIGIKVGRYVSDQRRRRIISFARGDIRTAEGPQRYSLRVGCHRDLQLPALAILLIRRERACSTR